MDGQPVLPHARVPAQLGALVAALTLGFVLLFRRKWVLRWLPGWRRSSHLLSTENVFASCIAREGEGREGRGGENRGEGRRGREGEVGTERETTLENALMDCLS